MNCPSSCCLQLRGERPSLFAKGISCKICLVGLALRNIRSIQRWAAWSSTQLLLYLILLTNLKLTLSLLGVWAMYWNCIPAQT